MAHEKGLLKGAKFNGRHSTVIQSAIPAVEAARDCEHVTKIALGVITPIRPGAEHLKFTPASGLPGPSTIRPCSTRAVPPPLNAVWRQPSSDLPLNMGRQSPAFCAAASDEAIRKGSIPMSMNRWSADDASVACSDDITRWPVRAA